MPYVEGFGTWPFGEEWLWEAIAGSYLPLLEPARPRRAADALADARCSATSSRRRAWPSASRRFVSEVRRETHAEDAAGLRAGGHEQLACELDRAWGDYAAADERMQRIGGDLLGALGAHAAWTSSATHAVLPLLATGAGLREQVGSGIRSHLRRFGTGWQGRLLAAGVRRTSRRSSRRCWRPGCAPSASS